MRQFPLLAARADADLDQALEVARGEIEVEAPAVYDGTLDARLDRAAWALHLDLATWQLRITVERDAETGAPPSALNTLRTLYEKRIAALARACAMQGGLVSIATFEGLGDPPLPGESTTTSDEDLI